MQFLEQLFPPLAMVSRSWIVRMIAIALLIVGLGIAIAGVMSTPATGDGMLRGVIRSSAAPR